MTPDDIRQQIELTVVEMLKKRMADGTIDEARAQVISQHILDKLTPGMTFDELFKVIPNLDNNFPELSPIILPILQDFEKQTNQKKLNDIRELIKQGQYDAAVKLGKLAGNQGVNIEWHGSSKTSSS